MENTTDIYQSKENNDFRLIVYKSFFYSLLEINIEVNDANRPKYPLLFRISKRCEEQEGKQTLARLMEIACNEYPGNTWIPID